VEFRSILRQPFIAVEEFGNAAHHFFRCNADSSGGSMYSNERRLSVNDNSAQWGDS